jgi:hypothetical protein
MVAMIPEAVEAGEAAAGRAAGAREIKPSRIKAKDRPPFGPEPEGPRRAGGGARGARVMPAAPQRQRQGTAPRGGQRRDRQFSKSLKKTGKGALRARLPGSHSYQPVILAEFLVAVVVVATGPVAKGGTATAQAKSSPSPYSVDTVKQLVAIGVTYFVLALLASSRRAGRFAAWFGALILLGLGFTQLASGDLTAIFKVFGPGTPGGTAAAGNPPAGTIGAGQAVGGAIGQGVQEIPDATGIFPTITPGGGPGFVQPGVPAAIAQQAMNQFGAGQTAVITQDNSTGTVGLA